MIVVAVEKRVVGSRLRRKAAFVVLRLLPAGLPVGVRRAGRTFVFHEIIPQRESTGSKRV